MANYNNTKIRSRNVIDYFKWHSDLEIKEHLKANSFDYGVLVEHWLGDFNLSTCFRNANAFGASEMFYLGGKKKYDPRGCVGVQYYSDIQYLPEYKDLTPLKEKYTFIAIDNVPGSIPIDEYDLPDNSLLCFGEEGAGVSYELLCMCEVALKIPQYGSVRSLNAGTASGIAMFHYTQQMERKYGKGIK